MNKLIARFGLGAGLLMFAACGTTGIDPDEIDADAEGKTLGQEFADRLLEVKPEHRALRICFLTAGTAELMRTSITRGGGDAATMLGQIDVMFGAVVETKSGSAYWTETEMAHAAFVFAEVFSEAGREKIGRILIGGLSVGNVVDTAKRGAITAYLASALLRDTRRMVGQLDAGEATEAEIWGACEGRIKQNRDALRIMTGARAVPGD